MISSGIFGTLLPTSIRSKEPYAVVHIQQNIQYIQSSIGLHLNQTLPLFSLNKSEIRCMPLYLFRPKSLFSIQPKKTNHLDLCLLVFVEYVQLPEGFYCAIKVLPFFHLFDWSFRFLCAVRARAPKLHPHKVFKYNQILCSRCHALPSVYQVCM